MLLEYAKAIWDIRSRVDPAAKLHLYIKTSVIKYVYITQFLKARFPMNSFLALGNDGKVQWLKASLATFMTPHRHPRARGTSEPGIYLLSVD
ncbi:hypothetical protein VCHA48O428_20236 [Vibrio chagasii]|nr:hypothetical protein VCHA48O428_20236 [Vibrio chagasii]